MEKVDAAGRLAVVGYCNAYPELVKGKSLQNIILKAKVNDNVLLYQIKGISNVVIKVDFSEKQNVEVTARDFLMDVVFKN
ncbi:hypothetical protein [Lactobacillus johnsonii]|uniref:hypothetical protein n=1 Tax=Lactobacillus johnsonii TaxID=33959 RepID=UPI00143369D5|nr:hypothetical protein [Lactobacillus johnsonii]GFI21198.1 hypothetical protein IMSAGC010_01765 [Lactobacillus johnsonii]